MQSLRKQSRGAQKTSSQYRGVTKHMKGKWEARIGQMVGRKYKSVSYTHYHTLPQGTSCGTLIDFTAAHCITLLKA